MNKPLQILDQTERKPERKPRYYKLIATTLATEKNLLDLCETMEKIASAVEIVRISPEHFNVLRKSLTKD
jgi:hypothetical protein